MKNIYKTIYLCLLTSFFCPLASFSQTAPVIEWQKCYGGTRIESANSIILTADGGYAIAGHAYSNNGDVTGHHGDTMQADYWIVKIDSIGTLQWQKSLGGTRPDQASSIYQTNDGGYVIAGQSLSDNGDVSGHHGDTLQYWDSWIVKTDSAGNIQWQKSLGSTDQESATAIFQTFDGSYFFTGRSGTNNGDVTGNHGNDDYWAVKLDSSGTILWQKCFGGSSSDGATDIRFTNDGGFVVTGLTSSNDSDVTGLHGVQPDYWVIKIDSIGTLQWQKTLGGFAYDGSYSIIQSMDGGYLVTGYANSNDGDVTLHYGQTDYWIVKLDTTGNIQWEKSFGGTLQDIPIYNFQTSTGDYFIAGRTSSDDNDVSGNHGGDDVWIIKIDSSGNLMWQKCFGGTASDGATQIKPTPDGGYIVAGYSASNDGDVSANHGNTDMWIVKLAPDTITSIIQIPINQLQISISPNPVTDKLNVTINNKELSEIILYDIASRKLMQTKFTNSISLNTEQLAKGIYIYEIRSKDGSCKKGKIVKD